MIAVAGNDGLVPIVLTNKRGAFGTFHKNHQGVIFATIYIVAADALPQQGFLDFQVGTFVDNASVEIGDLFFGRADLNFGFVNFAG